MVSHSLSRAVCVSAFAFLLLFISVPIFAQGKMDSLDRDRAVGMLKNVRNTIRKEYYDENFRGINIDERFAAAEEKVKKSETLGQAFGVIAQAVIDLNDSHTVFIPPARNAIVDYGWTMKMFGDRAFITNIREGSDAEKKGVKIGDEVVSLGGFRPTRTDMWKMIYFYRQLNPQSRLNLSLRSPNGETRDVSVDAKVTQLKTVINLGNDWDFNEAVREGDRGRSTDRHMFKSFGGAVIWKLPTFAFDPAQVDSLMANIAGRQTLILDLRGNPGGYVVTLEKLTGYFFEKDIKIADLKGRKPMKPQMAKSEGSKVFKGKLIVLIDSSSGSAAEIFARLVQLENRGVVLGDVSAGAVMQSRSFGLDAGSSTVVPYGVSVTNADVIMSDGKSIEHVGVQPNEKIVPTGADLAARRDPVMSRALALAGFEMDAASAGEIFPKERLAEQRANFGISLEF